MFLLEDKKALQQNNEVLFLVLSVATHPPHFGSLRKKRPRNRFRIQSGDKSHEVFKKKDFQERLTRSKVANQVTGRVECELKVWRREQLSGAGLCPQARAEVGPMVPGAGTQASEEAWDWESLSSEEEPEGRVSRSLRTRLLLAQLVASEGVCTSWLCLEEP